MPFGGASLIRERYFLTVRWLLGAGPLVLAKYGTFAARESCIMVVYS